MIMIPKRIQRYADHVASQSDDLIEKKAKRMQFFAWCWVCLFALMSVDFLVNAVRAGTFLWTELVAKTAPFIAMAAIMASVRDSLLLALLVKRRNSQPSIEGNATSVRVSTERLNDRMEGGEVSKILHGRLLSFGDRSGSVLIGAGLGYLCMRDFQYAVIVAWVFLFIGALAKTIVYGITRRPTP
jgi:hypothetical protein